MKYRTIKEVVSTIIRRVGSGKLPTTYHADLWQYISDAVQLMEVTQTYYKKSTKLKVCQNIAPLPCDYHEMIAVSWKGCRVNLGSDVSNFIKQKELFGPRQMSIDSNVFIPTNPVVDPTGYVAVTTVDTRTHYYRIEDKILQCTFADDEELDIAYWAIPVDEDNFPLIPDSQPFIEALYWYVLSMLIGSGWKHDVFSYQDAEARWNKWRAEGVTSLIEWTPEHAERSRRSLNQLVMPDYHKSFFINAEREYL